jgi:4-hydroxy-tetrahydrodipicolinate synthase
MRAGSTGFCGVSTNIHPDLYGWLHRAADTSFADELAQFLVISALFEGLGYPAVAKAYHQRIGTLASMRCRSLDFDLRERFWAFDAIVDALVGGTESYRARIAQQPAAA